MWASGLPQSLVQCWHNKQPNSAGTKTKKIKTQSNMQIIPYNETKISTSRKTPFTFFFFSVRTYEELINHQFAWSQHSVCVDPQQQLQLYFTTSGVRSCKIWYRSDTEWIQGHYLWCHYSRPTFPVVDQFRTKVWCCIWSRSGMKMGL